MHEEPGGQRLFSRGAARTGYARQREQLAQKLGDWVGLLGPGSGGGSNQGSQGRLGQDTP